MSSISTYIFGHVPISSLKLNASLLLYNISITSFFLFLKAVIFLNVHIFSNISDIFLFSLSLSNHGYLSSDFAFSLVNVLTNALNYSQSTSPDLNLKYLQGFVAKHHA